jgi:hypothetical protein
MRQQKKYLFVLFSFCLFGYSASSYAQSDTAQARITGTFTEMPFPQFIKQVEQTTAYRFYYNKTDVDSITVTFNANNEPLFKILEQVLRGTGLVFSADQDHHIFLSRNNPIVSDLPDEFFDDAPKRVQKKNTNTNAPRTTTTAALDTSDATSATLENKLYTIGDKPRGGVVVPGKATLAGYLHDIKTGEPLIGASVVVEGTKMGVVTDQFGYYSLTLPKGRNILNIQSGCTACRYQSHQTGSRCFW